MSSIEPTDAPAVGAPPPAATAAIAPVLLDRVEIRPVASLIPYARDQGDVWFYDRPVANDLHPTMKPVALVERAIRNSSKSRDLVLDPFGGSGTTLMACEATGRQARLIELDPAYCDVIIHRWQDFSGKSTLLSGTDLPFAAVADGRGVEDQPEEPPGG